MRNITLENNDNSPFNILDYQGDSWLMIVFFRGAWCNHCKKQLKEIEASAQIFNKLNTKIVAISCDSKVNSSLLKTFLGLNFPIISDSQFKLIDELQLRTKYKDKEVAKPAVFILKPDHTIAYNYIGEEYDDRLSTTQLIEETQKLQLQ